MAYSRYKSFIVDGAYKRVPFIKVPENATDCFAYYEFGKTSWTTTLSYVSRILLKRQFKVTRTR